MHHARGKAHSATFKKRLLYNTFTLIPLLLSVVAVSLSGVVSPGPMLAITISKSPASPWTGALIALGHAAVEIPLIALIAVGLTHLLQSTPVQLGLSIVGGGAMVWMGLGLLRARTGPAKINLSQHSAFISGIIASGLNPFFLAWWATAGSLLILKMASYGFIGIVSFAFTHWLMDLVYLSLISVLVYKTHSLWSPNLERAILAVCSLMLIGFGIWFIINGITTYFTGV